MTVQSPSRTYTVTARLRGDGRRLIAENGPGGEGFLLLLVDNPALARQLSPFFHQMGENRAFTDFIEFFPFERGFCAVFRRQDARRGQPLDKALSGASPAARGAVLRSLFAFLLSQEPPYPVLCDMLRNENLLCSASGKVSFIYDLHLSAQYDRQPRKKAMTILAETVRTVCGGFSVPSADALRQALTGQTEYGWGELYAGGLAAADELSEPPEAPETPAPRGRKKRPKAPGYMRLGSRYVSLSFLAGILLIALAFGLAYAVLRSPEAERPPEPAVNPPELLGASYADVLTALGRDAAAYQEQPMDGRHLTADIPNGVLYVFSIDNDGDPEQLTEVYLCGLAEAGGFIVGTEIKPSSGNRVTAGPVEQFALRVSNIWWGQDVRELEGAVFISKPYTIAVFYERAQKTAGKIIFLRVGLGDME